LWFCWHGSRFPTALHYREEAVIENPSTLVHHLLRKAYHPFNDVADLARCFAGVASAATRSPWAEIHLSSLRAGGEPRLWLHEGAPRDFASLSRDFPIRYQKADLGRLSVLLPLKDDGEAGRLITQALAFNLKRQEFRELAHKGLGRDLSFIGTSAALGRVDRFIEYASQTALPGLLLGDPGSEVERVALALHLAGSNRQEAFVQVNSATIEEAFFEEQWLRHLRDANHGTLLLAHLEGMALRSQHLLCQILESGLAGWTARKIAQPFAVRLLATGTRNLTELAASGQFCPGLLAQLDVLHLEVEPLRERREDIGPLLEHHLHRHRPGPWPQVSAELLEICARYDWPGDVSELAQVAARLAVMTETGSILVRHVRAYAPQILAFHVRPSPAPVLVAAIVEPLVFPLVSASLVSRVVRPIAPLGGPVLAQHPTLARAVLYINGNFDRKLPMAEVAANSYASGSYLAHLFQQGLATSFTRFLTNLRVERAKSLLRDAPHMAITVIAGNAGFSDLRHFERVFKSTVGCTPKMFRRDSGARGASAQEMP
jgi:AraC-like DNA-binding protein